MGAYFDWVNPQRKEYLSPRYFDTGAKYLESVSFNSDYLAALHTLLTTTWKDCPIIWISDYSEVSAPSPVPAVSELCEQFEVLPGEEACIVECMWDTYRNVSYLFKEAECSVREDVEIYLDRLRRKSDDAYDDFQIADINNPYQEMFLLHGERCAYTINHTKKIFYSSKTKVTLPWKTNYAVDPLPILMHYFNASGVGIWAQDLIGVSDSRPEGYAFIKEFCLDPNDSSVCRVITE